jgi:O-antigen/teichoic acid export membrane protein
VLVVSDGSAGEDAHEVAASQLARHSSPSILSNVGTLLSSKVMSFALTMVITVVVPRFIVPAELADFRVALSVWSIGLAIINLGTSTYVNLETARDPIRGLANVGPVILLRIGMFAVSALLMTVGTMVFDLSTELVVMLSLVGVTFAFDSVSDVFVSALSGLQRVGTPAVIGTAIRFVYSGGVILLLVSGRQVVGLAIAGLLASLVTTIVLGRYFLRFGSLSFARSGQLVPLAVRGSVVFFLTGIVVTLYQQVDTILIATLVDPTALGWYAVVDGLFSSLMFVPSVVLASIFPVLGRLHASGEDSELRGLVSRTFASFVLISVPIGVGIMIVGPNLALLLFGEDYRKSGQILVAFGPSVALIYGTTLIGFVATAIGRQRFWLIMMSAMVLLEIGLEFILVPWADRRYENGSVGGALVYVVTESLMLMIGTRVIAPYVVDRRLAGRLARVSVATLVMVGAAWPLRNSFIAVPVTAGAVSYSLVIVALRTLRLDEVRMFHRAVGSAGKMLDRRGAA